MLLRILKGSWLAAALAGPAAWFGIATAMAAAPSPETIEVEAKLDRGILKADEKQTAHLRIVIGARAPSGATRAPMNIALVIDRSGSMGSQARMENARRAAQLAVDRLGRGDILSVVSYDDRVEVEVPATKVTSASAIKERIARLTPRGSTAIHAGLLAGADEIRKFKSRERVNRIILLSDGLANVGPSQPRDFESLGRELASEGITVSTIGLGTGYNEDLMAGLARAADGGHVFVQESADLAGFLAKEFDDALGIVAQEVEIIITLKDGCKPVRPLGREARIDGNRIIYKVGALFGGASQVLLSEIEVGPRAAGGGAQIAGIEVNYAAAGSGQRRTQTATAIADFDRDAAKSEASIDTEVLKDVATLVARAARQEAVKLRDAGKTDEARRKFEANALYVREQQSKLKATDYAPLQSELKANEIAVAPAAQSREGWDKARKLQRQFDSNSAGASVKY